MTNNHRFLMTLTAVLAGFGILMVHSSSLTSTPTSHEQVYLSRQILFLVLGASLACVAAVMPSIWWFRASPVLLLGTLLLLVAVHIPGIGTEVNGSRRWLRLGGFSFQPSEFAKLALPLITARILVSVPRSRRVSVVRLAHVLLPTALVVPLVLLQPDLGTSLFLVMGIGLLLWISGWPLTHFAFGGMLAVPAVIALVWARPYQLERVRGLIATWTDFGSAPYQLKQSLVSLGAGGLSGTGLGKGWQKLSFLPEANTDFVFAVVGEELGLAGTLTLVLLWGAFFLTGMSCVSRLPRFGFRRLAATTILVQLTLQAAINVAVVTAMVPPKGIPHPFISYGGSHLISGLLAVGVMISLSRGDLRTSEQPLSPAREPNCEAVVPTC